MNKQRQQPDAAKVKAAPASPQEQSEEAAIAPYGNADRQALLAGEGQETGTVVGGAEGGGLLIDDEGGAPDLPPDVGFTLTLWRVRDEHIRELQRSNTDPGRVQQATQNAKQATDAVLRERLQDWNFLQETRHWGVEAIRAHYMAAFQAEEANNHDAPQAVEEAQAGLDDLQEALLGPDTSSGALCVGEGHTMGRGPVIDAPVGTAGAPQEEATGGEPPFEWLLDQLLSTEETLEDKLQTRKGRRDRHLTTVQTTLEKFSKREKGISITETFLQGMLGLLLPGSRLMGPALTGRQATLIGVSVAHLSAVSDGKPVLGSLAGEVGGEAQKTALEGVASGLGFEHLNLAWTPLKMFLAGTDEEHSSGDVEALNNIKDIDIIDATMGKITQGWEAWHSWWTTGDSTSGHEAWIRTVRAYFRAQLAVEQAEEKLRILREFRVRVREAMNKWESAKLAAQHPSIAMSGASWFDAMLEMVRHGHRCPGCGLLHRDREEAQALHLRAPGRPGISPPDNKKPPTEDRQAWAAHLRALFWHLGVGGEPERTKAFLENAAWLGLEGTRVYRDIEQSRGIWGRTESRGPAEEWKPEGEPGSGSYQRHPVDAVPSPQQGFHSVTLELKLPVVPYAASPLDWALDSEVVAVLADGTRRWLEVDTARSTPDGQYAGGQSLSLVLFGDQATLDQVTEVQLDAVGMSVRGRQPEPLLAPR